MKKKVLIGSRARSRAPEAMKILEEQGYELILNPYDRTLTETELMDMIQGVEGMIAGSDKVTAAVLAAGVPTLKIVAKQGVGYNTIDVVSAKEQKIDVTITPGANSKSVADLAMGLMLSIARNVPAMDRKIREKGWYRHTGVELAGKVLGIVGMGNIGGEVAKRAFAFGMKILAYDVYPRQDFIDQYGVTYVSLDEIFTKSDFVSLHAPAIKDTIGMVNIDRLRSMKKTAFIINTARGELIIEDDLYEALSTGVIAGAALDVYQNEPPADSKLVDLPNIVLTAHSGAYTKEAIVNAGVIAAEEIVRVLSGEKAKYSVIK
jgi:D-3-phosphoglycerate dehydrogenase